MKKRRKSPHYQSPVHYLVKAGYSRKDALQLLSGGLTEASAKELIEMYRRRFPNIASWGSRFGLAESKVEGANIALDPTNRPAPTVSAAYAEGLKDALRLVLESRRYG